MHYQVWSREKNDGLLKNDISVLKEAGDKLLESGFVPSSCFRKDLLAYYKYTSAIPHPKLLPLHSDIDELGYVQGSAERNTNGVIDTNIYNLQKKNEIMVRNWEIDKPSLYGLCFALSYCRGIQQICLFDVALSTNELEWLFLNVSRSKVTTFKLEWNQLGGLQHSQITSDDRSDEKQNNQHVECATEQSYTSIRSNEKTIEDAKQNADQKLYAHLLQNTSVLVYLSLRSNGITAKQTASLATALRINKTLKHLNLFQNKVGDEGAIALAYILPFNGVLQSLSLANNGITGVGTKALIGAITSFEATEALICEVEAGEELIQAELAQAKKAKQKLDRQAAAQILGIPILYNVNDVQYGLGNMTLQTLVLSGNQDITDKDVVSLSSQLNAFFSPSTQKMSTVSSITNTNSNLQAIILKRIPKLRTLRQSHQNINISSFIQI